MVAVSTLKIDNLAMPEPSPMKLKDEAYVDLERRIVTGKLLPGEWVSETDLMEISGHSRASIRSAVQRLEDQGLIEIFPRRGARICPIDYTQQFRALELRRAVEALIARTAAKRANDEQRIQFTSLSKGFSEAAHSGNQEVMTELDLKSYSLMLISADNAFAAKALTSVKGLSRRFWIINHATYGNTRRMAQCHADIAIMIAKGDERGADDAVARLIDYVEEFTLEVVGYSSEKQHTTA